VSPAFYLSFEILLTSSSAFFQFRRSFSNVCPKLRHYDAVLAPQTPGYTNLQKNAVGLRVWPFGCGKGHYAFLNTLVMEWEVSSLFEPLEGAQYAPPWLYRLYLLNSNGLRCFLGPFVPDSTRLPSPFQRCVSARPGTTPSFPQHSSPGGHSWPPLTLIPCILAARMQLRLPSLNELVLRLSLLRPSLLPLFFVLLARLQTTCAILTHEFFQPHSAIPFAVFGHAHTSHFEVFFVLFLLDDATLWVILLPLGLVLLARQLRQLILTWRASIQYATSFLNVGILEPSSGGFV
jgi:hypothetical protein